MNDPVGTKLGDYQILKVLGAGGMGRVYQVRNTITDRVEAMKVLLPDLQGREELAQRFLREIKVLAALNHPNIAALHTALTIENQLVMIMEFVEGQPISARLNSSAIPAPEALKYLDQVLDALDYAHKRGVIHRDIKPANMMLTPDGRVKLMDFGIARTGNEANKLTATGSTLGSLNYMSPEQIKGAPTDERSDLYSLGISLYEMVTGQRPFKGDSDFNIMAAHLNQPPTPPIQLHPELPAVVNDLILTSIAKEPGRRFQTAAAFREAVQRALQTPEVQQAKAVPVVAASAAAAATEARTLLQGSREDSRAAIATPIPAATAVAPAVTVKKEVPPPIAAAQIPHAAIQSSRNRGLYMGLGALIVVIVLVAAGVYLPMKKRAAVAAAPTTSTATQPIASNPPAPAASEQPSTAAPPAATEPARSKHAKKLMAQNSNSAPSAASEPAPPPGPSAAELEELENEIDQLNVRAAAVNNSLDRFQATSGYGLRGDMVAHQASMKINLAKAQDALSRSDVDRARKYEGLATADVEALEKFLGRR